MKYLLLALLSLPLLMACGEPTPTGPGNVEAEPAATEPADPVLADIYNRSCRSCHATGTSQAPLTGNRAAWAPRMVQGMDLLLDHTINGYQGMPPMGMCFDCDEQQFEDLIRFMAGEG